MCTQCACLAPVSSPAFIKMLYCLGAAFTHVFSACRSSIRGTCDRRDALCPSQVRKGWSLAKRWPPRVCHSSLHFAAQFSGWDRWCSSSGCQMVQHPQIFSMAVLQLQQVFSGSINVFPFSAAVPWCRWSAAFLCLHLSRSPWRRLATRVKSTVRFYSY